MPSPKDAFWRYKINPISLREEVCRKQISVIGVSPQLKTANAVGVIKPPVTKLQSSLERECKPTYRWNAFKTGFRHSRDPKQTLNPVCLFPCLKCQVAYVKGTRTFFWLKGFFNAL